MTPNLVLVVLVGVLFATGSYLLLARSLTRVLIGVLLLGNGANVLLLSSGGAAGLAPILGEHAEVQMSDPLPQALILTAMVITFGMMAFLLALAHRSWQLFGHDEVPDDLEDRRIRQRAEHERVEVDLEELTDPDRPESVDDSDFAAIETAAAAGAPVEAAATADTPAAAAETESPAIAHATDSAHSHSTDPASSGEQYEDPAGGDR